MKNLKFHAPDSLQEALAILDAEGSEAKPVAGGTNLVPALRSDSEGLKTLVDLSRLQELRYLRTEKEELKIGALTTLRDVLDSELIREKAPVLQEMARRFAGPLIRNRATLGGNLADASPAADSAPPLLALGARVTLASKSGQRHLGLDEFFLDYRRTVLRPEEILAEIAVPLGGPRRVHGYLKLGRRTAMAVSVASSALVVWMEGNTCLRAGAAMGAVAAVPLKLDRVAEMLAGAAPDAALAESCGRAAAEAVSPVDDIRATAEYRRRVSGVLMELAIRQALGLGETER